MNNLLSEFRDLLAVYHDLGDKLAQIVQVDVAEDSQALPRSILQNRDCIERITQMNARVAQLTDRWKKCRKQLDSTTNDETRKLVDAVKAQVVRLQKMCSINAEKLLVTRNNLENHLAEIGKGSQYLKSLKPANNNYPKFIDSMH
jgi:uncharacterized coiled-coil DUF342 family protein